MAYIINIQTGKGKSVTRSRSIPLPNKKRVRAWAKRSPVGNSRTKVKIKNTRTKRTITTTKAGATIYGWKPGGKR